jgi:hypothetical protein
MSNDPRHQAQVLEQERRRLSQRLDEVSRLCEAPIPPAGFYAELLQRLLESLAAPAGSVWIRTPQGNLQQAFQINFAQAGLEGSEDARASHDALLRLAFTAGQPLHLPPHSSMGSPDGGQAAPGNPTSYLLLLVPIRLNDTVCGLIEVLQGPNRPTNAIPGFLQYMGMMADAAGRYQRNQLMSQLTGQQQLWSQLEAFSRSIHGSLNPTEVAYHVANEGRRLIECDRLSVVLRPRNQPASVEAVSGADVVERRSNQVQKLRALSEHVLDWGERLVFNGVRDDSLPPKVLKALDEYIAESPCRQLVILPLRDLRDGDPKDKERDTPVRPPRSALVLECYEAPPDPAQTIARLEVVSRHATSALYNAMELKRIPFRFLWSPLAYLQEGLGGRARAILFLVVAVLSLTGAALWALPYPLRVDSNGQLLPAVRRTLYSPVPGQILDFSVTAGDTVLENSALAILYDVGLMEKLARLRAEEKAADVRASGFRASAQSETSQVRKTDLLTQAELQEVERDQKRREAEELVQRTNALLDGRGRFQLLAPQLTAAERAVVGEARWTIQTGDFLTMKGREVRPNEPIMRLGVAHGPWEVELKLPQKHVGQVLKAFTKLKPGQPLEVDFLLSLDKTRIYRGLLYRERVAGEATAGQDATSESEPAILAYVDIESPEIPEEYRVPLELLVAGTEVSAKVNCGSHRAGYSLFYGVWEFLFEKVVFFF